MVRKKALIALEGAHASGKTTLLYYIAARLKEQGENCVVLPEPARNSPLLDDVILGNIGWFDIPSEVDQIMNHISQCIRGTRGSDIILTDRTPISVLAYKNLLVRPQDEAEKERLLWKRCEDLAEEWMCFYDLVFYCQDLYGTGTEADNRRSKAPDQQETDSEIRRLFGRMGCSLRYIPAGLPLEKKGGHVIEILKESGFIGK